MTATPAPRWELVAHFGTKPDGRPDMRKHIVRRACEDEVLAKGRTMYPRHKKARFSARPLEQVIAEYSQTKETMQDKSERLRREIYDCIGTEEITGSAICYRTNLHRQTVASHIKALVRKGLVEYVQSGSSSKPMSVRRVQA